MTNGPESMRFSPADQAALLSAAAAFRQARPTVASAGPYDASLDPTSDGEAVHFRPLRTRYQMRSRTAITLNITSMVDMALLLLKFFIITTTFAKLEGTLSARLPQEQAAAVPLPIQPVVLALEAGGVDGAEAILRLETTGQTTRDFEQLYAMLVQLQSRPGFDAGTPVVIRGGADVVWDHMVSAWNAALRAGYQKVAFAGE